MIIVDTDNTDHTTNVYWRSWLYVGLIASVLSMMAVVGCRKNMDDHRSGRDSVAKSVHDGQYYFGLQKSAAKSQQYSINTAGFLVKTYDYSYSFVICRLDSSDPAVARAAPRYITNSAVDRREYRIQLASCTPAFIGDDGKVLKLVPSQVLPAHLEMQGRYLQSESTRRSLENGMIEVAAIGSGAALAGVAPGFRSAIMSLLPKSLPRLGVFTTIIQSSHLMLAPHQVEPNQTFFNLLFNQQAVTALVPAHQTEPPPPNRYVTAGVGFSGGVLGGLALVKAGASFGNPVGAIAAQAIIPFISTFILHHEENPAKVVLEHFEELFKIHQRQDNVVGMRVNNVPAVMRMLGKSLVVSGWVDSAALAEFCLPDPQLQPTAPAAVSCLPLFKESQSHYGQVP